MSIETNKAQTECAQIIQYGMPGMVNTNIFVDRAVISFELTVTTNQTWGNYQLVNYFLPISHYNWQLKVICPFNEYISFNSTSFDQLVCQLLLILLLLIYSNSNLMGLINYYLLDLIFCFWPYICNLGQKSLRQESFFSHSETFWEKSVKLIELLMGITNYFFKK